MHPHPPYKGSCLCGAVQVRVTAPPLLSVICHCRDCQKLTASDYSLTVMFPEDHFSCTGDLRIGGLGSGVRKHYFCKSCLSFIYSRVGAASGRINLRTSVLDAAAAFEPFLEVMTDEKRPWVELDLPRSFAGYPQNLEELQALMDAYAQR